MKILNHHNWSKLKSIALPNPFTLCAFVCLDIYNQLQEICVLIHEVAHLTPTADPAATAVTSAVHPVQP
jgi:hypothetical protein